MTKMVSLLTPSTNTNMQVLRYDEPMSITSVSPPKQSNTLVQFFVTPKATLKTRNKRKWSQTTDRYFDRWVFFSAFLAASSRYVAPRTEANHVLSHDVRPVLRCTIRGNKQCRYSQWIWMEVTSTN